MYAIRSYYVLNAMSRALAEIAQGCTVTTGATCEPVQYEYKLQPSDLDIEPVEVDEPVELDKDGFLWDSRINSTPASVTASGVWKMRRKPKDMDDAQWSDYIDTVRNELTNLMSIEVGDDVADSDIVEPIVSDSPIVDSIEVIPPHVTPDTVFGTVEPPVTHEAVEPVAPPPTVEPPATETPTIATFPQLMTWLTGMTGKITVEQVNGALAES